MQNEAATHPDVIQLTPALPCRRLVADPYDPQPYCDRPSYLAAVTHVGLTIRIVPLCREHSLAGLRNDLLEEEAQVGTSPALGSEQQ